MASQSRSADEQKAPDGRVDPYLAGWAATTRLMHEGKSWSGNERNCCFLNRGDSDAPGFANVSAITGLDVADDGRALALTDWDGDGDIDLWFKNRTGPQLRYFQNNVRSIGERDGAAMPHFVALRLRGTWCNRDAIGATVRVELPGRSLVKELRAGEGYLAQSSKWLHFGLGSDDRIERIVIRWPGGAKQALADVEVDRRYTVVQGQDKVIQSPVRRVALISQPAMTDAQPTRSRIVLKEPIPLPPSVISELHPAGVANRPRLLVLWASWCEPCLAELAALTDQVQSFERAGLGLQPVNLDDEAQRRAAMKRFEEIVQHRKDRGQENRDVDSERDAGLTMLSCRWSSDRSRTVFAAVIEHVLHGADGRVPLPASLLVDAQGRVQIIYLGLAPVDQVHADGRTYGMNAVRGSDRSSYGGRWFYRTYRDWSGLGDKLDDRGLSDEATFYRVMATTKP